MQYIGNTDIAIKYCNRFPILLLAIYCSKPLLPVLQQRCRWRPWAVVIVLSPDDDADPASYQFFPTPRRSCCCRQPIGIIILRAEPPRGTWGKTDVDAFVSVCQLPTRHGADALPDDGQSDLVC
jgi:hypothetical protein